jgi:hypothetical protein
MQNNLSEQFSSRPGVMATEQLKPIYDGIVDETRWSSQELRPLFIGKEPHDSGGGDWSIADTLRVEPNKLLNGAWQTWRPTAYIAWSLFNGFPAYQDIPSHDDPRVMDALRNIAFINIGKLPGDTSTSDQRLETLYNENKELLFDQIEAIQPNIIIGWRTLYHFLGDDDFNNRFQVDDDLRWDQESYPKCISTGTKLFVQHYHPARRGRNEEEYVNGIVNAVQKFWKIEL